MAQKCFFLYKSLLKIKKYNLTLNLTLFYPKDDGQSARLYNPKVHILFTKRNVREPFCKILIFKDSFNLSNSFGCNTPYQTRLRNPGI